MLISTATWIARRTLHAPRVMLASTRKSMVTTKSASLAKWARFRPSLLLLPATIAKPVNRLSSQPRAAPHANHVGLFRHPRMSLETSLTANVTRVFFRKLQTHAKDAPRDCSRSSRATSLVACVLQENFQIPSTPRRGTIVRVAPRLSLQTMEARPA